MKSRQHGDISRSHNSVLSRVLGYGSRQQELWVEVSLRQLSYLLRHRSQVCHGIVWPMHGPAHVGLQVKAPPARLLGRQDDQQRDDAALDRASRQEHQQQMGSSSSEPKEPSSVGDVQQKMYWILKGVKEVMIALKQLRRASYERVRANSLISLSIVHR